uniref:Thioredoxin domain-containing protein n=1 Tax=Meloidogyne enterolobii TaxID=390850 RepID=A0A6V7WTM3_MELEN|nr:unnamed protein product [Meloidogyne enterolobii]
MLPFSSLHHSNIPSKYFLKNFKSITTCSGVLFDRPFCISCKHLASKSGDKIPEDEIKIDLKEISRKVAKEFEYAKEGKETELDKNFMNFSVQATKQQYEGPFRLIFSWKYVGVIFTLLGSLLVVLYFIWQKKVDERERSRKMMIGRARIGGEWELTNMEGKLEGSKDLLGKWLLIYFGFTNCPDICPVEIEKLVDVIDILDREDAKVDILPIFISVDPERDTIERVRRYCAEFSPKLRGYTGTKEQVGKVAKAFRIYHSEGPRTKGVKKTDPDDYIVDHTVICYLIDPDGQFHDYYGQNRRAREIAQVIKMKALQWDMKHGKSGKSWIDKLSSMISNDTKDVDQKTTNLENSKQNTTVAVA